MAISTKDELKTAMMGWSDRTDLSGRMDDFVTLADARIRKDMARHNIRVREMETRADLTPSSGACTLPTDFMAMIAVQCLASNPTVLSYKPMTWLNEAYPNGDSGTPAYYGIEGDTLYMFPLTSSDVRVVYWAYPAALDDDSDTNWLLTKYPDIYTYAGLIEVKAFEQDTDGLAHWVQMLAAAFDGLKTAAFGADASHGLTMGASAYPT